MSNPKNIIITGAASGIGRATAVKLSAQGHRLALQDINQSGLAETRKLCHIALLTKTFDVSDTMACDSFIQSVLSAFSGRIDHVFNCAGVNPTAIPLEHTTDEYWNKLVNTNLKGTYNMMRACIPYLQSGASIVNTSSNLGLRPGKDMAIYCATKYGIIGLSKATALELGPRGIRVNIIAPGFIDTPTNSSVIEGPEAVEQAATTIALKRIGTPEEVANIVAFLMSEESSYMNGSVVEVTGGLSY